MCVACVCSVVVRVCVCVFVCACVRVCVRACVCDLCNNVTVLTGDDGGVVSNRLQPETKPESHVPSGSWVMSDVWEDVPKDMLPPDMDTVSRDSETTLSTTQ